jgi:hypothetical protein
LSIYFWASVSDPKRGPLPRIHEIDALRTPVRSERVSISDKPKNIFDRHSMDNLAVSDRFIKSLLFAFFFSAVAIFVLQITNLIDPDHLIGREGAAWLVATLIFTLEPLLRHHGVLKGAIESRIGEFTKASVLGRLIGAPVGCLFAWAITIVGS